MSQGRGQLSPAAVGHTAPELMSAAGKTVTNAQRPESHSLRGSALGPGLGRPHPHRVPCMILHKPWRCLGLSQPQHQGSRLSSRTSWRLKAVAWSHSRSVVTVPSRPGQVVKETRQATDQVDLHAEPLAVWAPSLGRELSDGPCLVPAYHVLQTAAHTGLCAAQGAGWARDSLSRSKLSLSFPFCRRDACPRL